MSKNYTKADIVKNLSIKTGFSSNYSKKIINDYIKLVIQGIKENNFILKNVGSFKIISKRERLGRNPRTKQKYIIRSRKTISYSCSKKMLKILNKNK